MWLFKWAFLWLFRSATPHALYGSFTAAFLLPVAARAGTPGNEKIETPEISVEIESVLSNGYQSEGRENVEGLFMSNAIEVAKGDLGAGWWWGEGLESDYTEHAIWLGAFREVGFLELYGEICHLDRDGEGDWELLAAAEAELPADFYLELEAVYSIEEAGSYFELGLERPMEAGPVEITPGCRLGVDAGYDSPDGDGPDQLEFEIEFQWWMNRTCSTFCGVGYSFALGGERRDGTQFETGIRLEF